MRSNGDVWKASIGYDGSKLSVQLQDGRMVADTIYSGVPIDIDAALGTNRADVGFTSGTGAGWQNHDILSWQFANTTRLAPPPPVPVPEPASEELLLFGGALLAVFALRNRS